MKIYRFVGTSGQLGDIGLDRIGQRVELAAFPFRSDGQPAVALVSDKDFESAGFTEAELEQYGHHATRGMAKPEFMAKLQKLWPLVGAGEKPPVSEPPVTEEVKKKGAK